METRSQKLAPAFAWLFAAAAAVLGLGSSYVTSGMGWKVSSGVFFAIFFLAGAAATFATRARAGIAILAFLLAAVAVGGTYYLIIAHAASAVAASAGADAQGQAAAGSVGNVLGGFVAVIAFLDTLVAGIAGCVVGAKARSGGLVPATR